MNGLNGAWAVLVLPGILALGGCAATHVGNDWQCPLTQGAPCLSVAAADPARVDSSAPADPTPVHRSGEVGRARHGADRAPAGESGGCPRGCRPFAWLRRALEGGAEPARDPDAGAMEPNGAGSVDAAATRPAEWGGPDETRTREVIGRIWIAPYVDDDGVYHEAGWVRAVLEPATWRLP